MVTKRRFCTKDVLRPFFENWFHKKKGSVNLKIRSAIGSITKFCWDKPEELPTWFFTYTFGFYVNIYVYIMNKLAPLFFQKAFHLPSLARYIFNWEDFWVVHFASILFFNAHVQPFELKVVIRNGFQLWSSSSWACPSK